MVIEYKIFVEFEIWEECIISIFKKFDKIMKYVSLYLYVFLYYGIVYIIYNIYM